MAIQHADVLITGPAPPAFTEPRVAPQVLDQGICRVFQVSPTGFLGVCNKVGRPRGTKGMMFTFLAAEGNKVGSSLLEQDQIDTVKGYLASAKERGVEPEITNN